MTTVYITRWIIFFLCLICQSGSQATSGSRSDEGKIKMPHTFHGAVELWQRYNCSFPDPTTYIAQDMPSSAAGFQEPFVLQPCAIPEINQGGHDLDLSSRPELYFRKQLCTGFYLVSIQLCNFTKTSVTEASVTSSSYYIDSPNLCVYATQLSKYQPLFQLVDFLASEKTCSSYCTDKLLPVCQRYIAMLCTYAERQQQDKLCMPPSQLASNSELTKHNNGDAITTKTPNNEIKNDNQRGMSFGNQGENALSASGNTLAQQKNKNQESQNQASTSAQPNQQKSNYQEPSQNQANISAQSILSTDSKLSNLLDIQSRIQNGQGNQGTLSGPDVQSEKKPLDTQDKIEGAVLPGLGQGMQKSVGSQNTDTVSDNDTQQNGQGMAGQQSEKSSNSMDQGDTKNMQDSPDSRNANGMPLPSLQQTGQDMAGQKENQLINTEPGKAINTQNSLGNQNPNRGSSLNIQQIGQEVIDQSSNTAQVADSNKQNAADSQNTNMVSNSNVQQNIQGISNQQGHQSSSTAQQVEDTNKQNVADGQNTNILSNSNVQQNIHGFSNRQENQSSSTAQQGGAINTNNSPNIHNTNQVLNSVVQGNDQGAQDQQVSRSNNNEQDQSEFGRQNSPTGKFPPWTTQNNLFPEQQTSREPFDPSKLRPAEVWGQKSQNNVQNLQQPNTITYKGNNQDVPSSGHFFAYFLTAVVICISGYVIFHNKQKIIAFVVEGRNGAGSSRRRGNGGVQYTQLQSNVEEVMPSLEKAASTKNFVY